MDRFCSQERKPRGHYVLNGCHRSVGRSVAEDRCRFEPGQGAKPADSPAFVFGGVRFRPCTYPNDSDGIRAVDSDEPTSRIRFTSPLRTTHRDRSHTSQKPSPSEVLALKGDESLFSSDEYLIPAIEDDPLLRASTSDLSRRPI